MMLRILLLGIATAVFSTGAAIAAESDNSTKPELAELESVDALQKQFNADSGKRRLLLLLSPT